MKENLSREDFIRHHRNNQQDGSWDDLDRKAMDGFQYLETGQDLDRTLQRIDVRFKDMMANRKSTRPRSRVVTMYNVIRAAAIILLIIVPVFLLLRPESNSQLFNDYFTAAHNPYYQITRSAQASQDSELSQAFAAYELKNYERAGELIDPLVSKYPEKEDLKFYQAIVLMAQHNCKAAIPILEECLSIDYQGIDRLAPWYLALAYLHESDELAAGDMLQSIIDHDLAKSREARALLGKIK